MARKPMVTRTLTSTTATILCIDVKTAEPFNKEFVLPRAYNNEELLLKKARELYEVGTVKLIAVVDVQLKKMNYKMSEEKFIENADEAQEVKE